MRLALTFDDGPGPSTPRLLDVLARHRVRATFFLLGRNIERAPEVVVRLRDGGHVLGNHGYSHSRPDAIDARTFVDELLRTDALLGHRAPVRLPYGPAQDDVRLAALASLGRTHVHWTSDFGDWLPSDPAELASRMRAHVEAQASLGLAAVIDLHDSSKLYADRSTTVDAVDRLLELGGYDVFTVPA